MTGKDIQLKVISHLRANDIRCPYCQTLDILGRPRFVVVPNIGVQQLGPKKLFPVVNAICTNCSGIIQFSAGQLGLLEDDEPSKIKGSIQKDLAEMKRSKN